MVRMLEERGAEAVPCPMIAIRDAPDAEPVAAWLRRFADGRCDDLVLMTGEGLRRLLGFARRLDLETKLLKALGATRKITRGPKPVRALREIGLNTNIAADEPTTEGVITAMRRLDLSGRYVGVQLNPGNQNPRLMDFIVTAGAVPDPVLPYVYTSEVDDARVIAVMDDIAAGRIDAIAFTSAPQVRRFRDVARISGRQVVLVQGLQHITVAAVGPVVAAELETLGVQVDIMPRENAFFMKPLVRELAAALMKVRISSKASHVKNTQGSGHRKG